jgi:dephospho-CoA kinase
MSLICIVGNIGSGKSTASTIFIKNGYEEITFAGPVKEIGLILGFEQHELYGTQEQKLEKNKFWGVSGREFMQKFATDIMRNELNKYLDMKMNGYTIWVRLCEKKIINMLENNKKIIVSDGRFIDEINMIKKLGGKIIKINRSNIYLNKHESENYIKDIIPDIIIDNNGTLDDLENKIKKILNQPFFI